MFRLFGKDFKFKLFIASEDTAVKSALNDLLRDFHKLSIPAFSVVKTDTPEKANFVILTDENDPAVPHEAEAFSVKVTKDGVRIVGFDSLGTVFGIYRFEEKLLGIPPLTRFTDQFPDAVEFVDLPDTSFSCSTAPVRFRGWFINDEDLLTDFKIGPGRRHIDYPFYQHVMHPEVLEMVLESALRCRMNLIIPSSFVDLANPDEAMLVEAAYRRGLYITQHHVEPMGVSYFAAQHYIENHHLGAEVSYIKNPAVMHRIWRSYAKLWSKYQDRVIWQLGLRGKGDSAVWVNDKSVPNDMARRGEIISNAIADQYQIVKDCLGTENFLSTSTL